MAGITGIFKITSIAVLLLLFSVGTAQSPCPSFCRFRLCFQLGNSIFALRQNPILLLRPVNRFQGPFPCEVGNRGRFRALRNVVGGEASISGVRSGLDFVPISDFDNTPRFQPDYFSLGFFDATGLDSWRRRRSRGNQDDLLQNTCVRLPVISHDRLRPNGRLRNRVFPRGRRSCIGAQTRVPVLDIELIWDTSNDLNLRLVEPAESGGEEINRGNTFSANRGRLGLDSGGEGCIPFFGAERVVYLPSATVVPGTYTIRVDNMNQCSPVTTCTLRVSFEGQLLLDTTETISTQGTNVIVESFTIPA